MIYGFLGGHVAKIDSKRGKNFYQMYLLFSELFIKLIIKPIASLVIDVMLRPTCCRYLTFDTTLLGLEFSMGTPTFIASLQTGNPHFPHSTFMNIYNSVFYSRKRWCEHLAGENLLGSTFLKK